MVGEGGEGGWEGVGFGCFLVFLCCFLLHVWVTCLNMLKEKGSTGKKHIKKALH